MKILRKTGNKGLSLVELLVAVAMMAILVSPLLGMMVTSANIAKRGRLMADATNSVQNVAEGLNAAGGIERIITQVSAGGHMSGGGLEGLDLTGAGFLSYDDTNDRYGQDTSVSPEDDTFIIGLRGLRSSSGGRGFDAVVTLDSLAYFDTNSKLITQYSPMKAVFTQPSEEEMNPDMNAAKFFAQEAVGVTGAEYTAENILEGGMRRVIDVIVIYDDHRDEISASARYTYEFTLNYEDADSGEPVSEDFYYDEPQYEFYRAASDGNFTEAVYFFFYPNYERIVDNGATDVINIYNNLSPTSATYNRPNLEFPVFLVKQQLPDSVATEAQIMSWESSYRVSIALRQNAAAGGRNAAVYSNLGTNLISGSASGNTAYRIRNGVHWITNVSFDGLLVKQESSNRLYTATIDLYEQGTLSTGSFELDEDKYLTTFNSTKTN